MKQVETVVAYTLDEFIEGIVEKVKQGWDIDRDKSPILYGFIYECGLVRDATQIQLDKDAAELAKPTRAEILAKARAAKAAKATE
jgi:hypothetical protein